MVAIGPSPTIKLPVVPGYQIISKNTFVDVVDISKQRSIRRTKSDSSISSSTTFLEDGKGEVKQEEWLRTAAAEKKLQRVQRKARQQEKVNLYSEGRPALEDPSTILPVAASTSEDATEQHTGAAATTPNAAELVRQMIGGGYASAPMEGAVPGRPDVAYPPVEFMAAPMAVQAVQLMPIVHAGFAPASSDPASQNMATLGSSGDAGENLVEQLHRATKVPISELQVLFEKGTLQKIPRNGNGEITSIGSIGHATGACSNCLFWFRGSCAKGLTCEYCHFKHKGQQNKRIRRSKRTREQLGER